LYKVHIDAVEPTAGYRATEKGTPPATESFSTSDTTQLKRAIDMTDDELAAIASGATLHVVK
jgi:hypothetical protein